MSYACQFAMVSSSEFLSKTLSAFLSSSSDATRHTPLVFPVFTVLMTFGKYCTVCACISSLCTQYNVYRATYYVIFPTPLSPRHLSSNTISIFFVCSGRQNSLTRTHKRNNTGMSRTPTAQSLRNLMSGIMRLYSK
jgi:hypothetical protein